ncbi:MAG: hypothetical protein ABI233_08975, partial [Chthoniobacterales bacterium]
MEINRTASSRRIFAGVTGRVVFPLIFITSEQVNVASTSPSNDACVSGEALLCSLFAEGSRQGHFFSFAFFTADFLAPS